MTGLYPDYCLFDGKPYRRPNFDYNTDRYQYDAIRCPMNVGMDYYLTGKAKDASKREQSDARIDSAEREQARPKVKDAQRTMMRRLLTFLTDWTASAQQ